MSYLARATNCEWRNNAGWKEKEVQVWIAVLGRTPDTEPAQVNLICPFHPSTDLPNTAQSYCAKDS